MKSYLLTISWVLIFSISHAQPKEVPVVIKRTTHYVFFPLIVKSPEYKWGAGLGGIIYFKLKHDSITRTSNIKITSFATVRKQAVLASEGYLYTAEEKFIIHYAGSFSRFPDKFWGMGNESQGGDMENYAISQVGIYPQVLREIRRHLFAGIGYEFQRVFKFDYNQDGTSLFDEQNITGRNGGTISGTGLVLTWDSRNNAFSSSKGFYIQYFNTFYREAFGSQFEFNVQSLDVRKYFSIGKNDVLAFQMNTLQTTGNVPIRNLAIIGSDSFMRGYYMGRYQDKTMFAFQTEFRLPVYRKWGLAMFSGIGKVGPLLRDAWNFQKMKLSIGAGVRYAINTKEKLNLRFDSGVGFHSHGSYLNLGEAF